MFVYILFGILLLMFVGKVFGFAARAAWTMTKLTAVVVLFPLALVALAVSGLIFIALPLLLVAGLAIMLSPA